MRNRILTLGLQFCSERSRLGLPPLLGTGGHPRLEGSTMRVFIPPAGSPEIRDAPGPPGDTLTPCAVKREGGSE